MTLKVGILGAWHLGAVVAACLAEKHDVFVHDKKSDASLQKGVPAVDEPGLAQLLKARLGKSLHIVDAKEAIAGKDFVIIAHDSPVDENDEVDISPIMESVDEIKQHGSKELVVVVMSQVPVGTCKKIKELLMLPVVYAPENLRLGEAISCFLTPDVVVIGSDSEQIAKKVSDELFSVAQGKRAFLNVASAEMWKHSMNTYLSTMITLANSLADICEQHGGNITDVVRTLKLDKRISEYAPLGAGIGFGGGTLGREVSVLQKLARASGSSSRLFDAILEDNRERPQRMLKKIGEVKGRTVAVLGLAYKAGTNTLRRSIGLKIARDLQASGAKVRVFDPAIKEVPDFVACKDISEAAKDSDALLFVTDWPEFRSIDWKALRAVVRNPLIVDCRNMMDAESQQKIRDSGFAYKGVGI